MGLSREEYSAKTQTVKNLENVCNLFDELHRGVGDHTNVRLPDPWFPINLHNTVLLDDSVKKAIPNPFSHIPIPEFDLTVKLYSVARAVEVDDNFDVKTNRSFNDKPKDMRAALEERLAAFHFGFVQSPHQFLEGMVPASIEMVPEKPGDIVLLGVIGILEELKDVLSIPAWIAAGGLKPEVNLSHVNENTTWEDIVRLDLGLMSKQAFGALSEDQQRRDSAWERTTRLTPPTYHEQDHVCPATPPDDEEHLHWWQSPPHFLYWVRRGMMAVQERGVTIRHGMPNRVEVRTAPAASTVTRREASPVLRVSDEEMWAASQLSSSAPQRRGGSPSTVDGQTSKVGDGPGETVWRNSPRADGGPAGRARKRHPFMSASNWRQAPPSDTSADSQPQHGNNSRRDASHAAESNRPGHVDRWRIPTTTPDLPEPYVRDKGKGRAVDSTERRR
jgi:hypothetical protein